MTTAVAAETLVKVIPELPNDEVIREHAAEFISRVAMSKCVEAPTDVQPIESLYLAIQLAEAGNEQAHALIETNVRTDVIERTMKAGHIMSVDLMVDETGKIRQHGQSMDSVQANSLRFAADSWQMRQRTEAETRNAFRIQHYYDNGDLEDYYFVVFSRAADNMTESEMKRAGFFTETMSCAIQVTSAEGGRLVTESAFVAGVRQSGAERHDEETVKNVGRKIGVDLKSLSAAEILDTPLLIPKSMLPNGAIDLVAMYDNVGGTFFGENKLRQDYLNYLQVCREREERFEPKVQQIVEQLIKEASQISSPLAATQRLHKISEEQMLQQAIGDDDIDPRVFGPAAIHIEEARRAYQQGQPDEVIRQLGLAAQYVQSSSCPGGGMNESNQANTNDSESCIFTSKECPVCHAKNVKTTVTKTHISGSCGCIKQK